MKRIIFTGIEKVELQECERIETAGEPVISGDTVATLISPGTELARYKGSDGFPQEPGYAAVFRKKDSSDLYFCEGKHRDFQEHHISRVKRIPEGMDPETALFARIIKIFTDVVSYENIVDLKLGGSVKVLGRGLVAYMFRKMLEYHGIQEAPGNARLILECEGKEENILQAGKGSTVYLVGAYWGTPCRSADILRHVFYERVTIKSGWEKSDFDYSYPIGMLQTGGIHIGDIYDTAKPEECQGVYQKLAHDRNKLTTVFKWE